MHAVKLYPAGATTNSDAGVTDLEKCAATLARMEKLGLPLLVHGEVTDPAVDIFDREAVFIDTRAGAVAQGFPRAEGGARTHHHRGWCRISCASAGANVAATITAHHLLLNRNAIFAGGIRPHHYCLPVLKREAHRQALVAAATSGNPEVLPRHRLRAACQEHQGSGLRLRRLLYRACRHRAVCRGLRGRWRARQARRLRQPVRRGFLRPAAQQRHDHAGARSLARAGTTALLANDPLVPLRAGETIAWRLETVEMKLRLLPAS